MSEKVANTLAWIKGVLEKKNIDYQIVGGLAASIHGGTRPVADIDLYIHQAKADELLPLVQAYISKPLKHYVEEGWDLEYFQLIYQGQKIEIGLSPGTKIFCKKSNEWIALDIDFTVSVSGSYCSVEVPVIPVSELIAYKSILDRDVDRVDIGELTVESKK